MAVSGAAFAQLNSGDMGRYLAKDAVPVVDGHVVFTNHLEMVDGITQQKTGEIADKWLAEYLGGFDKASNRIISSNPGEIVAMGSRDLVFTDNAISYDKALMSYVLTIKYSATECNMEISRIKYVYDDGIQKSRITAEEYIVDEFAVNKKRTKLTPITGKFRKKTLDFVDEVFASFNDVFKYYTKAGLAEIVKNAPQVMQVRQPDQKPVQEAQPATPAEPVKAAMQEKPAQPAQHREPVAPEKPVQVAQPVEQAAALEGFRKILPEDLQGNFIQKISKEWMLITAGNKDKFNMMTASWGGIGVLYNKPVAICFINPARYTYQIMENGDTYTLTFYPETYRKALEYCGTKSGRDEDKVKGSGLTPVEVETGAMAFGEASIIIECKKLVSQSISLDAIDNPQEKARRATQAMHKMYIGEIVNVWVK